MISQIGEAIKKVDATNDQITRMLKSSIARTENAKKTITMANRILELEKQVTNLSQLDPHLRVFLQEIECAFDVSQACASPEIALRYIEAAKYMEEVFNRKHHRIKEIKHWYDNYSLPFNR